MTTLTTFIIILGLSCTVWAALEKNEASESNAISESGAEGVNEFDSDAAKGEEGRTGKAFGFFKNNNNFFSKYPLPLKLQFKSPFEKDGLEGRFIKVINKPQGSNSCKEKLVNTVVRVVPEILIEARRIVDSFEDLVDIEFDVNNINIGAINMAITAFQNTITSTLGGIAGGPGGGLLDKKLGGIRMMAAGVGRRRNAIRNAVRFRNQRAEDQRVAQNNLRAQAGQNNQQNQQPLLQQLRPPTQNASIIS